MIGFNIIREVHFMKLGFQRLLITILSWWNLSLDCFAKRSKVMTLVSSIFSQTHKVLKQLIWLRQIDSVSKILHVCWTRNVSI